MRPVIRAVRGGADSQRRNPVLGELQRLKQTTEIGDIPSDYQVGEHAGLLFLR